MTHEEPLQVPISTFKYSTLWLLAIVIFAFGLRIYKLDARSIFLDEKFTMVISQAVVMDGANQKDVFNKPTFTPKEFWKSKNINDFNEAITKGDIGNSPAYYAVIHAWMEIFGLSDFSARFPSVIFSTLTILLLYFFVKRFIKSERVALLSCFLASIEPFFIAYSHQARNYSMSFFLILLASYLFLRVVENEEKKELEIKYYIFYALVALLSLLSHFLTFTIFVAHGLYVLFFLREKRGWFGLGLSMTFAISGMVLWMTIGGGKYTLFSLEHQAKIYKAESLLPLNMQHFGSVLIATPKNVFIKSLPIFSDLFLFSNGLTESLNGTKNTLVAILVGLCLVGLYKFKPKYDWLAAIVILGSSMFYYSESKFSFPILSLTTFMLFLIIEYVIKNDSNRLTWFLLLMTFVPSLFLVIWSFRNGHTYGLTQRYGGFSFPFAMVLTSIIIDKIYTNISPIKWVIVILAIFQLYHIGLLLKSIYDDKSMKYTYFTIPRRPNLHYEAAQKIKLLYETGDTIKYPNEKMVFLSEIDKTYYNFSLKDAQLTNLYLPKDAEYIQKIDTTEYNKIVIVKKKEKKVIELVDLGKRY